MKKSLLFSALAVAAFTASAQVAVVEGFTASQKCTVEEAPASENVVKKAPVEAEDEDISGSYMAYGLTQSSSTEYATQTGVALTFTKVGDGAYTIKGFFPNLGDDQLAVNATYADGVVTIPNHQQVGTISETTRIYLNVYYYSVTDSKYYYSKSATGKPITMYKTENGFMVGTADTTATAIVLGWMNMNESGSSYYPILKNVSGVIPANAEITESVYKSTGNLTYQYPVRLDLDTENKTGRLWGVFRISYVDFTYDEDGNVAFDKDASLYYTSARGQYHMYKGHPTTPGSFYYDTPAPATIKLSEGKLELDPYILIAAVTSSEGTTSYYSYDGYHYCATITFEPIIVSGVADVTTAKTVKNVQYVNLNGQVSATPFQGVNIVVTNYTDGSRNAVKVMK